MSGVPNLPIGINLTTGLLTGPGGVPIRTNPNPNPFGPPLPARQQLLPAGRGTMEFQGSDHAGASFEDRTAGTYFAPTRNPFAEVQGIDEAGFIASVRSGDPAGIPQAEADLAQKTTNLLQDFESPLGDVLDDTKLSEYERAKEKLLGYYGVPYSQDSKYYTTPSQERDILNKVYKSVTGNTATFHPRLNPGLLVDGGVRFKTDDIEALIEAMDEAVDDNDFQQRLTAMGY